MANQEIAIAISAASFGLVVGFLAGYAVRAYLSYLRRRPNYRQSGRTKAP
jgi:Na+/glutamate symporter